ncbi:DNA topoisomerase IB [Roseimicrobium gellanilyticum]|nr:DNA topoisomerase IB [Roseimicrobium gellanilyticum]
MSVPPVELEEAGLRFTNDDRPGLRRVKKGNGVFYEDAKGKRVRDADTLDRIKSLVIPPAWTDVWICPQTNGHLQATGRDARGRKQYRYHPRWRQARDETKFHRILAFARALPKIRRRVKRDLRARGMERNKVLATVVRLLEATLIRIGNDEYAKQNGSYGLTTIRNHHAKVKGSTIKFSFRGKSGKKHDIDVKEPTLARVVRRCQDLPGQELFAYETETGVHDVGSSEVNAYIREISGSDFTAKDFRTWAGTVLAAIALREFESFTSQAQAKKNIVTAIEAVASMLGNTPAVCRKCYVHPAILDCYLEGATIETIKQKLDPAVDSGLRNLKAQEAAVVVLLDKRLHAGKRKTKRKHAKGK